MTQDENAKKSAVTRRCPVCGHESWRIIYGMVMPNVIEQYPKAEFAGCVIVEEERVYLSTGQVKVVLPSGLAKVTSAVTVDGRRHSSLYDSVTAFVYRA